MMEVSIKRDGLILRGQLEGNGEELVILFHGFKGDIGYHEGHLLVQLSQQLNATGYRTLRINFNGCGTSDGQFQDMTVLNEMCDALAIIQYALRELNPTKLHLLGHSQGGVVASMIAPAYKDKISSLSLLAPASVLKEDAQVGDCQGVPYDPNNIPDILEVSGFRVGSHYFRLAQYLPIYEMAIHYLGPVLLIHGTDDPVVNIKASEDYTNIYQSYTFEPIEGARHDLSGDGNQRQIVIQKVLDFLSKN